MGADLVPATWAHLDDAEVRRLLGAYRHSLGPGVGAARVTWHSPRPMSAASLVEVGTGTVFVKRHHPAVRSTASLVTEHALADHVRRRGAAVPEVVVADDGSTVTETAGARYEVQRRAEGIDLYAEVPSWRPYATTAHAASAGAALARFHLAAAGFVAPPRPPGPLMASVFLVGARDPQAALGRLLGRRPALARALARLGAGDGLPADCVGALVRAGRSLRALPRRWGHGDWHPSNLTWSDDGPSATVTEIFDLGLANCTVQIHDVAVALERSCVDWLAPEGARSADVAAIAAFLEGYASVRPPAPAEWRALPEVLPACHIEYALSEVEYFAEVTGSDADAGLALHEYLVGHCRYFESGEGAALLGDLRRLSR